MEHTAEFRTRAQQAEVETLTANVAANDDGGRDAARSTQSTATRDGLSSVIGVAIISNLLQTPHHVVLTPNNML